MGKDATFSAGRVILTRLSGLVQIRRDSRDGLHSQRPQRAGICQGAIGAFVKEPQKGEDIRKVRCGNLAKEIGRLAALPYRKGLRACAAGHAVHLLHPRRDPGLFQDLCQVAG